MTGVLGGGVGDKDLVLSLGFGDAGPCSGLFTALFKMFGGGIGLVGRTEAPAVF